MDERWSINHFLNELNAMSLAKIMKNKWKDGMKRKTLKWRKQGSIERLERPSRLGKARTLGYKAKQGYCVVRVSIKKGGRTRPKIRKGRKPTNIGRMFFTTSRSKRAISENRAVRKYPNMEVLNSYYAGEDGQNKYYEVILIDTAHPAIKNDSNISWITSQRRRSFRGITPAGRKSRGL